MDLIFGMAGGEIPHTEENRMFQGNNNCKAKVSHLLHNSKNIQF